MRGKIIRRGALLAALAVIATPAAGGPPTKVGAAAPEFRLTTFAKRKVRLSELRGKVVVINYWATWCGPCKAEMPMMHAYFEKNRARGLEMFGVTTEDSLGRRQLQELSSVLSYPLANRISGGYGAIKNSVPSTYIIDRRGILRVARTGAFTAAQFREAVDPLLDEAP